MPRAPSPLPAIAMAAIGIASFSLMDAAMKQLSLAITPYNALLWRSILGIPLAGTAMLISRASWPDESTMALQFQRAVLTTGMAWLFFYGVTQLPLAEAIALSFIAPLIALYLAALILGERVGRQAVIASLLGLAGVGIILSARLGGGAGQGTMLAGGPPQNPVLGALAVLGSALLYAYGLILQRRLAQMAHPASLAFVQSGMMAMLLGCAAPWLASMPQQEHWPLLIAAAALAIAALLALSWAYARAEAQALIPVEYSAFVWAAICGSLFFGESLGVATLVGTAIIITACLLATRARTPMGPPPG